MLGVARSALGICCASRGSVYGSLRYRDAPSAPWLVCSQCPRSISGDSRAFARLAFDSEARRAALPALWRLSYAAPACTCIRFLRLRAGICFPLHESLRIALTLLAWPLWFTAEPWAQLRGGCGEGCSLPEACGGWLCRADRCNISDSQRHARYGHTGFPALPVHRAAPPPAICR